MKTKSYKNKEKNKENKIMDGQTDKLSYRANFRKYQEENNEEKIISFMIFRAVFHWFEEGF